jgi:hypothetical protein
VGKNVSSDRNGIGHESVTSSRTWLLYDWHERRNDGDNDNDGNNDIDK